MNTLRLGRKQDHRERTLKLQKEYLLRLRAKDKEIALREQQRGQVKYEFTKEKECFKHYHPESFLMDSLNQFQSLHQKSCDQLLKEEIQLQDQHIYEKRLN